MVSSKGARFRGYRHRRWHGVICHLSRRASQFSHREEAASEKDGIPGTMAAF